MYKLGDIIKNKSGNFTNQIFLLVLDTDENYCVVLFDNLFTAIVGDQARGYNFNEYEISNLRELSEFVINNNL